MNRVSLNGLSLVLSMLVFVAAGSADVIYVDTLCYFEQGVQTHGGIFAEPTNALGNTSAMVSLGWWSDNPDQGTNDRPVGICLGFSTSIVNGEGDDLNVVGNPFSNWFEPGYVEVARETNGVGATADGWQDETFYLIKPSNYDAVGDPRLASLAVGYPYNANWAGQQNTVTGYADVKVGGDKMDLSAAIDAAGHSVSLSDIAYVRIRTATDDSAGVFGHFSTEVVRVEALNGVVPEPASLGMLLLGGLSMLWSRKRA